MIIFKALKKTILFILKEIASFAIKILIVVAVIVGLLFKLGGDKEKKSTPVKENSYLELNLSSEMTEKGGMNFFSFEGENINFYKLLNTLDAVKVDERVDGIILKNDSVSLNRAQIEELSQKIDEVKATGKKVYSFSRILDNRNYSIALDADEIVMPPTKSGNVDIKGYYTEARYLKRMSDKIGVKYNVIHVGDYKAFGESYIREDMSEERKTDLVRILDSVYYDFVERVAAKRNVDKNSFSKKVLAGEFVLSDPFKLEKEGLIDSLEYYHEFLENRSIENTITLSEYVKYMPRRTKMKDKIAVIYAEGNILYTGQKSPKSAITPENIIKELEIAEKNDDVKGIVIRVDSPGGSALASEVINAKIKEISKPVYISMGGTAASGGYYIAVAAEKIYAENSTITGSIGVVSVIPNFSELGEKLGVNTEIIEKGELSGVYSLFSEMSPIARKRIYKSSLGIYDEFKERVTEGRRIGGKELESIAGGRVWLGKEALENGLVDELGGMQAAISGLASSLELEEYSVLEVRNEKPLDKFLMNYSYIKNIYGKVTAVTTGDEKVLLEDEELLIRPVMYFPYNF